MGQYDDLRQEFENLIQECCTTQSEDIEEEYPSFTDELIENMLAPAKSGLYFSRWDIKVMAGRFGESIQVSERKKMFKDLMKSIKSKDDLKKLFDIFSEHIDSKVSVYKELVENFPSSAPVFEDMVKKSEKLKDRYRKILNEFDNF
ncbi:hypothetical protein [Nitrosophilus alvini]|uniref:hypothetical protein n=1 Tax=Nitrosophilus alvini TaxID=2714855 RepID=UPI00190986F0|nr:hypothetical protein [Nitrosophilus alvini]